ncbi:MAG: hypothetical protein DRH08_04635 [Deltaproteobacteria bacterium]|nr:MAG: hypothetical protein DRH08_04635 [Deltaproteobacteria bacterium]
MFRFNAATLFALATRPEMALLVVCYTLGIYAAKWEQRRQITRSILVPQLVMVAVGVGVLWLYFGTPVPYSFYAKSPGHYEELLGNYELLPGLELERLALSLSPLLLALITFPPRRKIVLFVVAPQLLFIFNASRIVWVMGYHGRFYMPVVGALLLLVVNGLARASHEPQESWSRLALAVTVGASAAVLIWLAGGPQALLLGLLLAAGTAAIWRCRRPRERTVLIACFYMVLVQAAWAQAHGSLKRPLAAAQPFFVALSEKLRPLDSDLTIAATEHGYLGAENPEKTIIDLAGLHDPIFAHRFHVDQLFAQEPDLILMPRWVYHGMIMHIEEDKRFQRDYLYISLSNPVVAEACEKEGIGVAIRRDVYHTEALMRVTFQAACDALGFK